MESTLEIKEKERIEILNAYRNLMRSCPDTFTKKERKEIRRAFEYAVEAHEGARRKSGEPYIFHPIAVAKIVVKEIGLDPISVICALLHDVVEDTFRELQDIQNDFGGDVARIIDGLTKISGVFDHKSSAQAENFRKMLLTLSDDIRVILIKLADRLHNMRTLEYMKKEGQLKIASETLYLYAPLANRLGLHALKAELEDLALKFTETRIYDEVFLKLKKTQRESRPLIQGFIRRIREQLNRSGLKFTIKYRFKSIYSIYSKMSRQGIPFEEVFDLFAVRIILKSEEQLEKPDCWKAYSLITELYPPNPERLRDWITIPKSNGYESLHVTVMGDRGRWIEVQIRTERMDLIAEQGMAAHWRYKENGLLQDDKFNKWLERVRDLLETPNMNAVDVVREFKTNLVTDEVYAFTPAGDLIQLPNGSTALDFAYEIHTKIGEGCIGAKVNHKVVPLSYKLQNGDQVEIITSKKQHPKVEWLKFAHTSKAKHKIKDALRRQRRAIEEKGQEIYLWRAEKFGIKDNDKVVGELLAFFEVPNRQEFYYLLGSHQLDMKKVQEFIELKRSGGDVRPKDSHSVKSRQRIKDRRDFERWLRNNRGMDSDMLMIGEDMDITDYTFGNCCQPIPGDDILGFFHPDEGLVIHRTNCSKAIGLMSNWGKNIIKARWTQLADITFLAGVHITGEDRQGMMNSIIKVISSQMKINIRSITIDSNDGLFEGVFKIFVRNTSQVDELRKRLKAVSGVFSVVRLEVA